MMKFFEHRCKIYVTENPDKGYDRKYSYEWHDPNTFETFIVRFDEMSELLEHHSLKKLSRNSTFSKFEIDDNRLVFVSKDDKKFKFGEFDNVEGLVIASY